MTLKKKDEEVNDAAPVKKDTSAIPRKVPKFKTWGEREQFFMKHPHMRPKE